MKDLQKYSIHKYLFAAFRSCSINYVQLKIKIWVRNLLWGICYW